MFSIFRTINPFAGRWRALDFVAIFFARFLPYLMMVFLFGAAVWASRISLFLYPLLSGLFSRFVFGEATYIFYRKDRPATIDGSNVLIPVPRTPSFPSGHASFFFGLSFMLFSRSASLAVIFLICTCLVTISRVFSGVHWFKDILAGMIFGALSALIVYYLLLPWALSNLLF